MNDLHQRIANLSPEKRALLERRLMQQNARGVKPQGISQRDAAAPCPLSFAQQRLWFLDQLEPASAVYNIVKAVRLRGTLHLEALRQALDAILERHEALRTTFSSVDGDPIQVINEPCVVPLAISDLRTLPAAERESECLHRLREVAQRPFNLSTDTMLRAALVRLQDDECVLLLVMHHIASDGWSVGLLMRELSAFYTSFVTGSAVTLPALPIQYADYAVWQRQWLQGEALATQVTYWKQQLKWALPVLELPRDYPRPMVQTYRGARQALQVPPAVTEGLKTLSRQAGVTLFMTLLAAWQTLLFRYTGQEDISVGTPIAGRTRAETEGLIGFFVNTLVLRTDLSGDPTFMDLLPRVREMAMGAYAYQDLPFEKLVEEVHPERNLSHSPLFQVMFAFQNVPRQTLDFPGLEWSAVDVEQGTAKFDMSLALWEETGGLAGSLEYNTDLFATPTITRIVGHLQTLLAGIAVCPTQRLSQLPLLAEVEQQQLLVEWNTTQAVYPQETCVHELIGTQAARTPDDIAVVCEGAHLTYRELDTRANQLGHYLRRYGVGPDVLVGICMERSLDMLVGMLGILKAGGAYVPLDPAYPQDRIAFMIEDSGAPILLTHSPVLSRLPDHRARVVCVDTDWEEVAREREDNPMGGVVPEHLAYVIYTSGSTGKPKGVQIPHRAVVNFLHTMGQRPGIVAQDVLLAVTTLSFDIAGLELFLPLTVGARVVVVSRAVAADGHQLARQLAEHGATIMQATPATWRLLLESGWQGHDRLKILCGGEALPEELAQALLSKCAGLWNMYGPTETTIWSTVAKIDTQEQAMTIGRPIANTQLYVLDRCQRPVPIGVPGELYIGGAGVARGYLYRPDLTAERFVEHPFSQEPAARLYRTGDLVRYRSDGTLEFLGRIDHQVKIRGFRIELGEIETVLTAHPAVREAVVIAREDTPGDKRLVAYVVTSKSSMPASSELRSFLRQQLPEYMIPTAFMDLDALPLTPNGKVDRRALPVPERTRIAPDGPLVTPRDALDLQLTQIWEKVLGLKPIGLQDNFFELGGHSLLAVRLFGHIERLCGKKLPLATLFQAPTIEQLANVLRQKDWVGPWSSLVAIQPGGTKPPFFCIHAHGGDVLFYRDLAQHLGPDQPFYALQAQGLDGTQPHHTSIDEMAAHYLKEIRTLQLEGPYFLGGYCLGAVVVFEMAQQLHAQGEEVGLLVVFDSYAPGVSYTLPYTRAAWCRAYRFGQILYQHMKNLTLLDAKERRHYMQQRLQHYKWRFETDILKRIPTLAHTAGLRKGSAMAVPSDMIARDMQPRLHSYVPKVYPGRITLFRSSAHLVGYNSVPQLGWGPLAADGVEMYEVPGHTGTMFYPPHVRTLAMQLRACMARERAEGRREQTPELASRTAKTIYTP